MYKQKINIESKYDSNLINTIIELEKEEDIELEKKDIDVEFKKEYL